jgi:Asp-tRNA(Asn)/Glu-tRNA(Gln) amidotransferase A subunit family amidase
MPCGWSSEKLPIGVQIVGKAWCEAKVLEAGRLYEQASGLPISIASLA